MIRAVGSLDEELRSNTVTCLSLPFAVERALLLWWES